MDIIIELAKGIGFIVAVFGGVFGSLALVIWSSTEVDYWFNRPDYLKHMDRKTYRRHVNEMHKTKMQFMRDSDAREQRWLYEKTLERLKKEEGTS